MHAMRRFLVCAGVGALLSIGCGGAKDAPVPGPAVEAATSDAAPTTGAPVDSDGVPKIVADDAEHDFGGIKASDTVEHVFTVRNDGTADLKIERVQRT